MYVNTEGIILRQTKTVNGRKMVLLFSKKYGKISAGTSINEKGKNKSSLAMHPFTYGKYELFKNREFYNVNGADVIKSFYKIGENVDRYMCSSYILEMTEKMLTEELPNPGLFNLIIEFFEEMEKREKKYQTLVLGYELKALKILGIMPELERCVVCQDAEGLVHFCIEEGGLICGKCANNLQNSNNDTLIYDVNFGIVEILKYFVNNPLIALEKIAWIESKPL